MVNHDMGIIELYCILTLSQLCFKICNSINVFVDFSHRVSEGRGVIILSVETVDLLEFSHDFFRSKW
jgi:hypothetical protein